MKITSAVFVTALLAGCATPGDLLQSGARSTQNLRLPYDRAPACMARAAENYASTVNTRVLAIDASTTEIVVRVEADTLMVVHVKPEGASSQATFWRSNFYRWSADVMAAMTRSC